MRRLMPARLLGRFAPPKARRRGQPRPRVVPWWRTWTGRASLRGLPLLALALTGLWGWHARWPERVADWGHATLSGAVTSLGFAVTDVWVIGRRRTPRATLIEALDVTTGDPILEVDLADARERLLALPWVRDASVRRVLPDRLIIDIRERRPLALWQYEGRFTLIGETGAVLAGTGLEAFSNLPIVVGPDAPPHAADLIDVLRGEPEMFERVEAGVRFGRRRWNLHLDGGVVVRLPELDMAAAWQRLAEYHRLHGVLDRDIDVLDLRFPDQVIIRPREGRAKPPAAPGRST